jgi:hypothetical protein
VVLPWDKNVAYQCPSRMKQKPRWIRKFIWKQEMEKGLSNILRTLFGLYFDTKEVHELLMNTI